MTTVCIHIFVRIDISKAFDTVSHLHLLYKLAYVDTAGSLLTLAQGISTIPWQHLGSLIVHSLYQ